MAIIDIFDAEAIRQVIGSLGVDRLVHTLMATVEHLKWTIDNLSSDASTTLASITLLVENLTTDVKRLTQTTDTLSYDVSVILSSTALLVENLITAVERLGEETDTLSSDVNAILASTARLVETLIATTNGLALNINYLLQGCIVLVALLCLLTVLCIVRWCYTFSRELRSVQHLKTA
ncbi:hypothetical protein F4604DRAFT_1298503 [Suillus subluteus]|nr:hypothetical protein F4604DRAFT_1298503 [Suillus subluteus]